MAAALALVAGACTSSSSPIAEPSTVVAETAVAEEPTSTPEPPTPTPVPVVVSNQDRITAALAQLEADVAAGEGPGHIAYDVLDQNINADGDVTFTLCTWTRDTVFDEVRDSLYRTTTSDTGDVTATHITTPLTTGDCLNTELINTAFDFIDQFDVAKTSWSLDPSSFASDERATVLMEAAARQRLEATMQRFVEDDIYFEPAFIGTDAEDNAVVDSRYRRFRIDGVPTIEVVVCRQMNAEFGRYRDGVLLDSEQPSDPDSIGPHTARSYELERSNNGEAWLLSGEQIRNWANCDIEALEAAYETWLGADGAFARLPQ